MPNIGKGYCLNCKKIIPYKINRDKIRKKFCSMSCRTVWGLQHNKCGTLGIKMSISQKEKLSNIASLRVGNKNSNWKGGVQKGIYITHWIAPNKKMHAHRFLMEQLLGRKLLKGEVVHHIDGDKHNNDISNLVLCKDMGEHRKLHCSAELVIFELVKKSLVYFDRKDKVYKLCLKN